MARHRICLVALVVMASSAVASPIVGAQTTRVRSPLAASAQVVRAEQLVGVPLPASGALAPSPTAHLFPAPLPQHRVLGFIGAGGFAGVTPTELSGVGELVTNMTNLTATGSLSTTAPGWTDLNDPALPGFVATAHGDGDRVLLGIANGSRAALVKMLRTPANGATRLANAVTPILTADHLDGVDLDIEGGISSERSAFTTFVTVLDRALVRTSASSELVVNVNPSSASTPGFFNIGALGKVASALFVMDYDMVPGGAAGPNAPLVATVPQLSVLSSLLAFIKVVSPSKLILGIPFYGYDFPTKTSVPGSVTTGPAESVTYDDIVDVGRVGHWDAVSLTPYYVFRRGKQWHETYYDDPVSIALKTALASVFHLAGVGVWSLGQEGNSTAMVTALDGGNAPLHLPIVTP